MSTAASNPALTRGQTTAVLVGASVMVTMSMGMRQSWGLFTVPITQDLGISVADFMFAIALQNIVWGASQPVIGAYADKFGARPITVLGTFLFAAGIGVTMIAEGPFLVILGLGVIMGLALSCTGLMLTLAATARAVSEAKRSIMLGTVSATGSIGAFIAAPIADGLIQSDGWLIAMVGFLGLCVIMLPAAFCVGSGDKATIAATENSEEVGAGLSLREVLAAASRHKGYVTTAVAFFVCGLQLIFIAMHLPNYLALCGQAPGLGALALGVIGGFNAIGCYILGWMGGRYSKPVILGVVYLLRSLLIVVYFLLPATPVTTLVFAALIGLLWLGIAPVVTGLIAQIFGLRYVATLTGIAFFFHQLGSFIGVWGAGIIVDSLGSYDLAWQIAVVVGTAAGIAQIFANDKPTPRTTAVAAA